MRKDVVLPESDLQNALAMLNRYRRDPVAYCSDVFGSVLWSKQREILESVRDNPFTTVRACHAPGKTFTAANAVGWWLGTHIPSIVVSTAPTGHQVKDLLWAEINTLWAKAKVPMGGDCLTTRINIAPNWYAVGLSTREPQMFQGFHSPNILIVVDEANGVDDTIFEAIDGILSTASDAFEDIGNVRLLMIGNPIVPVGKFYDSHTKDIGYNVIKISAYDTPLFTGEKVPARIAAHLTSPTWVQQRKDEWGEESPLFLGKVLGEFPGQEEEVVIVTMPWLMTAQLRAQETEAQLGDFIQIGVDVARLGTARTIFAIRSGAHLLRFKTFQGLRIDALGRTLYNVCRELLDEFRLPIRVAIDAGGVGGGLVDTFRPPPNVTFGGVNFGQVSSEPLKFMFLRAEIYWRIRRMLQENKLYWHPTDSDPSSERAMSQLAQIRYHYDNRGRVVLESKEEMRERNVPSPDEADAVALAFCPMISQVRTKKRIGKRAVI